VTLKIASNLITGTARHSTLVGIISCTDPRGEKDWMRSILQKRCSHSEHHVLSRNQQYEATAREINTTAITIGGCI